MKTRAVLHSLCVATASMLVFASQAFAQSVEDFYKGKRLSLIIASGPGGGYDTFGRLMARHIGKHIPGRPNVVAQNMDGASGLQATNHLANRADRDGSVILATYNALTIQPMFDKTGVLYDPLTLNWIGSIGKQTNICVTWHTSPIKRLEQVKEQEVVVSSTGPTGNSSSLPHIFNNLLGTKFKVLVGYTTAGQRLALENGEVGGICGLSYSTLMASNPDWILSKKLNILAQFGNEKLADLPDVPLAIDFISDPNDKKILELLAAPQEMGRPFVAPPDVPADRVRALRRAFDATLKDPDYIAESKKAMLDIEPMTGEQIEALIKKTYATPKEIVDKAAALMTNIPVEQKK